MWSTPSWTTRRSTWMDWSRWLGLPRPKAALPVSRIDPSPSRLTTMSPSFQVPAAAAACVSGVTVSFSAASGAALREAITKDIEGRTCSAASVQDLRGGDGQVADPAAGGVVDGVGIAAAVPTMPISPMPLAPIGLRCASSSGIHAASMSCTSAPAGTWYWARSRLRKLPACGVHRGLLHQRHAQAHGHAADELRPGERSAMTRPTANTQSSREPDSPVAGSTAPRENWAPNGCQATPRPLTVVSAPPCGRP